MKQRALPPTVSGTIIPAAVTPNNNNSRTQTHGRAEGRSLHREHTATVTTTSRSHGGCLICHTSAHTEQHTHIKQQAGCKRAQPSFAAPTRYRRQSFHCCLLRHTTSHRRKSPRHQIHNKKDASAPAAAGRKSLRTYPRHPRQRTTKTSVAGSFQPPSQGPQQPQSCACVHSQRLQHGMCVHVLVCLAAPIFAVQLCGTKKTKESNGRERQIAHTQITHIITHTHTQPRNGCTQPQNQKGKQNKKPKRGTTSAHTLSLLP
ncbi:hypothetical protein TCDM_11431 [Trypanosoma cruzi Dm28c]|uniref:Uncharacterized protein n=1 Tax=Trypanosoma cruzi Dm28c TaxID=1416333 RepID=V5B9E7_TRYCR|nr:hypothetical protein TCDM_11431 [Trypanosoma cruzi Dm28c]